MAQPVLYRHLFETVLAETQQDIIEKCLERAKEVGQKKLSRLSNSQLSGLNSLADQFETLEELEHELSERQKKRWSSGGGNEPLATFKRDIPLDTIKDNDRTKSSQKKDDEDTLWSQAHKAVQETKEQLSKALDYPAGSDQVLRGVSVENVHLELTRRYLRAAVSFAKIKKGEEEPYE